MIELNEDQLRALDGERQPASVLDPRTGQVYRLIRQEVYELVCGVMKPFNREACPSRSRRSATMTSARPQTSGPKRQVRSRLPQPSEGVDADRAGRAIPARRDRL